MSFEFAAKISQSVSPDSLLRLKNYLINHTQFVVSDDRGTRFDLVRADEKRGDWNDVSIEVNVSQVYIAFHTLRKNERAALLGIFEQVLSDEGIPSNFEEL